jgi:1,4-dihydroxy-2-naphthoate octaprenyltransferase
MGKLLRLTRSQFMLASLTLFIIGASWAIILRAPFSLPRMLLGYLIILPAHLSNSFSNEYFDMEVDRLGSPTLFSGGTGTLVKQPGLRRPALWISMALISISLLLGILFLILYSYPIWFLGLVVVGNLLGWFYSAPPLRLAYRGLGEVSTAFIAGFLIPGMGYMVTKGYVNSDVLLFTIPLVLYSFAFILSVEIPDMEADRLGHKKTWVAQRGRGFGFTVAGASLLAATVFFLCVQYLYSHASLMDFRVLGYLSLLPLGPGIFGMLNSPLDRKTATKLTYWIIITLAVFFILTDLYMVSVATRQVNIGIF